MKKTPWYSILNRGDARPIEILIYDEIGGFGVSAADLVNEINAAAAQPILLRVNSPGGSVFDGYAIYNALLRHAAGVEVEIEGLAASIASYIAMAGKTVRMAENALMMIHNPVVLCGGDSEEMRRAAIMLDKVKASLVDAYAKRTGLPAEELAQMMDAETWLNAEEAVSLGFADEVSMALQVAANWGSAKFRNAPVGRISGGGENDAAIEVQLRATTDPFKRREIVNRHLAGMSNQAAEAEVEAETPAALGEPDDAAFEREIRATNDPAEHQRIAARYSAAVKEWRRSYSNA